MKLSVVSDLMYTITYNGRPGAAGKLDVDDFFQFALASAGSIIRALFYEELQLTGDTTSFVSSMVEMKEVEIVSGRMGIRTIDEQMLMLPRNAGIFNIYPLFVDQSGKACGIDYSNSFFSIPTGSEWYYDQDRIDDLGLKAYALRGNKPVLYCDNSITKVALEGIFKSDDYDVPENIARAIINDVLSTVLKVQGFPIDMTDDGNPNVKLVNEKIAAAQT